MPQAEAENNGKLGGPACPGEARGQSRFSPMRLALLLSLVVLLSGCTTPPTAPRWSEPVTVGHLGITDLNESSGFAPSHRAADLLWSHNDSGGEPVVYALGTGGAARGRVRLAGATNKDWEDIASFTLDGQAYLLIADTGDNGAVRTDCRLYVIAEPDPADLAREREITVPVLWEIPVHYADHPRDCESVSVDAAEQAVYLLSKREHPVGLYRLPLRPASAEATPAAAFLTKLDHIPQPKGPRLLVDGPPGRMAGMPVGMDFAADGSAAVVLTYMDVLLFPREPGETWAEALNRTPQHLQAVSMPQSESVCFSADGREIYVTTEGVGAPVVRYRVK